ncbi:NUMOD4 domain-containing protein [Pedobacter agri]|uniref:NUMOD4 domain-containing protein n=1 Tax=Pedobacter agri TaxID=454586 RepID=A0A9X3DFK1_9SPHI|nr:NUMOD4 domain-containing protein [Pedobacter agri]MCX3266559.1 NUMOD4 domain-containing protein [Pedobacter agri]
MIYLGKVLQLSLMPISEIRFFQWRNEFWKKLKHHENDYLISSYGRLIRTKRNGKRRLISDKKNKDGYCIGIIRVYVEGVKKSIIKSRNIHRLVATTFICDGEEKTHAESKSYINHRDLNPSNNHYTNLEWVNLRENKTHSVRTTTAKTFTSKYTGVSKSKNKFRADIGVNGKKILLGRFHSELEAAKAYDQALIDYKVTNRYQAPFYCTNPSPTQQTQSISFGGCALP